MAIIITIMVLDLRPAADGGTAALMEHLPAFLIYVLSFVLIALMWINHNYLMHLVQRTDSPVMWANMHLLFWMSLMPYATANIGHHPGEAFPAVLYAAIQCGNVVAFAVLRATVARPGVGAPNFVTHHHRVQRLNLLALATYVFGAALAYLSPLLAYMTFALVPLSYLVLRNSATRDAG